MDQLFLITDFLSNVVALYELNFNCFREPEFNSRTSIITAGNIVRVRDIQILYKYQETG